ncbi:T-cell-interacting, activating receptor on myeloid cells protein 1, partial [Chelonia mydas]
GSLPKPSISVSPGGVIPVGGNVTIRCWHQRLGMRFLLYNAGDRNHPMYMDPASYGAEFPIPSARRENGGSYTCRYSYGTGPAAYSEASDPVQIIVADPTLPKPSVSVRPSRGGGVSLGGAVAIWCQGQHRDMRFMLNKEGRHFPPVDPNGLEAVFPISNVRREDGGSYNCSYHNRSEPFAVSSPSDPVELVVRAVPSGRPDFTHANIARLVLSAVILLVLGLILAETYYSPPREEPGSSLAEKRISPEDELLPLVGLKRRHKTSCSQTPLPR